tara:strand:- start:240 stop:1133 length:894 start_codon:yes stop_codon:yes gene_type:complete
MKIFIKNYTIFILYLLFLSCSTKETVWGKKDIANENAIIIEYGGQSREYVIYIPDTYDSTQSTPLVMNFHGGSGSATGQMFMTNMTAIADTVGFLIAFPQGTLSNGVSHWNSMLFTEGNKSDIDDIGFIETLIDTLENNYNIDTSKIYATGFSNGADFSYSLACYLNDRFAAIAGVAGLMAEESITYCGPENYIGIMIIHGTSDNSRPFNGIDEWYLSVDDAIQYWTNFNNVDSTFNYNYIDENNNQIELYDFFDKRNVNMVKLLKVINGGHYWFDLQYEGNNLDQNIWNFLSRHSK